MDPCEEILAELLAEYQRRFDRGERPRAEDFREAAGECFDEFVDLLGADSQFDEAVDNGAAERLPRPFGEYTLVHVLGRGGVGVVYRAIQRSLTRPVALKLLRGGWVEEEEFQGRFLRGARAAAQVEHDHAVRIHDFGVVDGELYLVMGLLPGLTLRRILEGLREIDEPPFGPAHHAVLDAAGVPGEGGDTESFVRRMAGLLAGPAEALALYHRRHIVHRDVKPGNLMLDDRGRLVVTDFDLVKRMDASTLTRTHSPLGTPLYMSPEQWTVDLAALDGRADVYSLGAVLYEAITLARPFEADDPMALMRKVVRDAPPDPRDLVPDLPRGARRIALKCLEKRPEDRYEDASSLARDLDALATGGEVAGRPVSPLRRFLRRLSRHRAKLSALLLLVAAFAAWWALRPEYVMLHVIPDPSVGEVEVDGASRGRAPLTDCRLPEGAHRVRVTERGFREYDESVELDADVAPVVRLTPFLAIEELTPETLAWLERHGAPALPTPELSIERASAVPDPAILLYPRAKVRRGDLGASEALLSEEAIPLDLVILDADGGEIHRRAVDRKGSSALLTWPAEWISGLEPGRYSWGLTFADSDPVLVDFELVADPDASELTKVRGFIGKPELSRLLSVAWLDEQGLHLAAWWAAMDLAGEWPNRRVYVLAHRALESLGLDGTPPMAAVLDGYASAR